MREVDADLVRAAGEGFGGDERKFSFGAFDLRQNLEAGVRSGTCRMNRAQEVDR